MKKFISPGFAVGLVLLLVAAMVLAQPRASASSALYNILYDLRPLSPSEGTALQRWARGTLSSGTGSTYRVSNLSRAIRQLSHGRNAVLAYVRGEGRLALYGLGVSDADIGPMKAPFDRAAPGPLATPQNRDIPVLNAIDPASRISLLTAQTTLRKDGTWMRTCVAFTNKAEKTAKKIVFGYQILDVFKKPVNGSEWAREGTFSPGVEIRPKKSDCLILGTGTKPEDAFLRGAHLELSVHKVVYDDGSSWTP
jgi:hypothetical protein